MKELQGLMKKAGMTKFRARLAKADAEYIPTMVVKEPAPTKKVRKGVTSYLLPAEKEDILAEQGAQAAFDKSMEELRQEEIERRRKKREEEEELESVR